VVYPADLEKIWGGRQRMETIAAVIVAMVAAFLLTMAIGKADCISECFGNGGGMQCTTCDSPKDGESRMATLFE
jgi:hypothetical protein